MRRATAVSILALLLSSTRVLPQQQTTATGVIEGTVVRSDNGEPIAGAQVMLTATPIASAAAPVAVTATLAVSANGGTVTQTAPPRPGTFQPVITQADGKFSFRNLDGGTYRVAATANGFVRTEYAQRSLNGQGRPVFLTAGQTMRDANLRMTPGGTLSGRVFDENGQPATGAPVQLLRATYNVQGRTYQSIAAGSADDRGDYRLYGVTPGHYYLIAGNPPGPVRPLNPGVGGPLSTQRFSLVYYPNASSFEQATTVEVKPAAETSLDMRVQRLSQGYRVRGKIVDAIGAGLPANTNVMVAYRTFTGGGSFSNGRNFDPATGNFELQNIPPGDYVLQVQLPDPNPAIGGGPIDAATLAIRQAAQAMRPAGQTPIQVVDKDLENVVLTVTAGVTVNGRFIVEGQPVSVIPNLQQMTLAFNSGNQNVVIGPTPAGTPAAADGTFQVAGLREGEYRVTLRGVLPPASGLYIKSIRYGGDEIFGKVFKYSGSGSGTFDVTLRTGPGQIAGNVTDVRSQPAPGVQVIAIPLDRTRLTDYRQAIADQNGRYSLTGLTPGDYHLFSWESIDNGAQFDPDFIKQNEQQAKLVHVAESSNQNIDVKLIPAQ